MEDMTEKEVDATMTNDREKLKQKTYFADPSSPGSRAGR